MDKKVSLASKIGKFAYRTEIAIASIAFALMCVFVLTTVVYRYILREPISWTEEASRYLMITGIFVAMPVAVHDHVHMGVEIFISLLPKIGQKIANIFSNIVTLVAYMAIDYACYLFVARSLSGGQTSPAMHIPMVYMYSIIMIGFILATIVQIANMVEEYLIHKSNGSEEVET